MPRNQHEDFGEKIGGAKKDLWRDRGLYVDDLNSMNDREAEKYVKKDKLGFRNLSCSLDAKYISRDEAGEWIRDRFGADDSVALLEQEAAAHEREKHWFE